jgi:hypothetical protein
VVIEHELAQVLGHELEDVAAQLGAVPVRIVAGGRGHRA